MNQTDSLLGETRRQTEVLEDIRGALLFMLALAIVGSLIWLAALIHG